MTTQPPSKSEESIRLLTQIAEGINALREEIHYLSSLIEPNANDTARLTETLDRIGAALAQPMAIPAAAAVAGADPAGTVTFYADTLGVSYNDQGKIDYRLKGGQYSKYGIRVWPEVFPALGIDPAALKPGPNPLQPVLHVRAILNPDTGQPRKVIGLAGSLQPAPASPPADAAEEYFPF